MPGRWGKDWRAGFARWRRLDRTGRSAVIEAALLLVGARLGVRVLSFSRLLTLIGRAPRSASIGGRASDPARAEVVSVALRRAVNNLPFHTSCMARALAASAMLRRRGLAPEYRLGARRERDGAVVAHIWVSAAGQPVSGIEEAASHVPFGPLVAAGR